MESWQGWGFDKVHAIYLCRRAVDAVESRYGYKGLCKRCGRVCRHFTSESKSWTVKLGANECYMAIRNPILDRKAEELPAEIIENYLRYGDT